VDRVFKSLWLLIALAALIASRVALAQNPAMDAKSSECTPPEICVEGAKASSTDTTQAPEANPQSQTDKKPKKKKSKKSDKTAKPATPERATGEQAPEKNQVRPVPETPGTATSQPVGPKKLANPECPRPYGPFTPTYCREGARASGTNSTTPQAAQLGPVTEPAEPSLDSLLSESASSAANAAGADTDAQSMSKEELFGVPKANGSDKGETRRIEWRGFVQNETAYTYADPAHWSRGVVRTQLGAQGSESSLKWKATARVDVDPIYYGTEFYPQAVRKDQRLDFFLRETYVDTSVGDLELRLGKQNIVWGEMVGLFFADVVSARDQRDFILPDFEIIRIPQWAMRAEYFGEKSHAEIIWLPYPDIDNIGKPGAEFYPFPASAPPGFSQQFGDEVRPGHGLKDSNFGARVSTLRNGWDLSAFYYRSTDVNPTFYRDVTSSPTPTLVFTPRHDRIWQAGGTLAKDLGSVVVKAETVYASGRNFNVTRLTEPTGVVPQDTLDYVLGLDFTLPKETRLNLQYFERVFFNHDPDLLQDRRESGVSLLLSGKIGASLEPEFLIIQSVNRNDSLMRPKLGWIPEKNWRVTFGVDVFTGPVTGFFGRFNERDRAYVELRYDF
jgi:hypothetical protein